MKKLVLMLSIIFSLNLFASLNEGKFIVTQRKDSSSYTMKIIVKNSKIIFIDYDCIDNKGVKSSTKDGNFRLNKEKFKKHILSLDNYQEVNKDLLPNEYRELFKFLLEKCESSNQQYYEL